MKSKLTMKRSVDIHKGEVAHRYVTSFMVQFNLKFTKHFNRIKLEKNYLFRKINQFFSNYIKHPVFLYFLVQIKLVNMS